MQDALEAELLTAILLNNSASPLRQALETTDLGQAPSPLCGLDDSQYEMAFACGLEGCANENAPQVEQLILETLRRDRKSTRLNSSHVAISYAVFCLKKKNR